MADLEFFKVEQHHAVFAPNHRYTIDFPIFRYGETDPLWAPHRDGLIYLGFFDSFAEAQAACQADFDQLQPPP